MEKDGTTKKLLSTFLRRLSNLSGTNRSLLLLKTSEQFLDLHRFSFLNREKSFSIIESLLTEKKKAICPVADARQETAAVMSMALKKLHRIDQFIFEERGSRDLHVGWPFVRGRLADGTDIRCPLLFFPVELLAEGDQWQLRFRVGEEITFNKTFLLAYSFYNQVKPDENLLNESFDDVSRDTTIFLTTLYNFLQSSLVEVNFNAENYRGELISFESFKKSDFEEQHAAGQLKLFPEAVLGMFAQAGSSLVADYTQLIEENSFGDLEDFFHQRQQVASIAKQGNFIASVREEKMYNAFPADIWQENAIKASKLGYSLVVQGPPGTGKSQLIANLVSDAIANEKRVLVVCQKRAALDVVYGRLKEKNLENFAALVHDYRNDRREIFKKIADQVSRTDEYKAKNISLDSIQLDRKFLQTSKRIDQLTEELDEFKQWLFDETECGRSIKELYLQCSTDQKFVSLRQEYSRMRFDGIESFARSLTQFATYTVRFAGSASLWPDRKSYASLTVGQLPSIRSSIDEVFPFFKDVGESLRKSLKVTPDLEYLLGLSARREDLEKLMNLIFSNNLFPYFKKMMPEKSNETNALWLSNVERMVMDCFDGDGPEASVPPALLGYFQKALSRGMRARKSLWSWLRWKLFSKDKIMITRSLVANRLTSAKEDFKILERKLDARLNLEHNLSKLRTKRWLIGLPENILREEYQQWFNRQQEAIRAKTLFNSIRGLKNLLNPVSIKDSEFNARLRSLIVFLETINDKMKIWHEGLSDAQIIRLSMDATFSHDLIESLNREFDAFCEFDRLKESLSVVESQVIEKIKDVAGAGPPEIWSAIFFNSLSLAWIDHIETKHPELRMVSSGKINALENELQEQIEIKHGLSTEILLLRARERVTDRLEFNRLNNRVSYRDLLHQATKKKKIWPLRKVISEFEDEIFKLLPCWMASPESVSAIFPMREMFDLVVFDEASQCFAERGIPALYRGKQTVIAGDNKQLRPGDFYQVRWQEEDFDEPDAEVESLLELASRYLMTLTLNGHYRSQSLELIDFSNRHFYSGSLQLLPDFIQVNLQRPSITYHKVDGTWEDNTNETEARHVADLVLKLHELNPSKDIGVVTFNASQQTLVQDCIEEIFRETQSALPPRLFVKNIENVQGDERDIIIFSIGYAPDKRGKISMQFGSLNADGGENRLNVAVSRAREKVEVVTSVWPEQLETENTKNQGPKLLREYLAFARDVSTGNFRPFIAKGRNLPFTLQLKQKILAMDLGSRFCEDRFPFYDLSVGSDHAWKGAVFTDDDFYYEALSAKAPHALLPQLLKKKHWPSMRVYSRHLWSDKKRLENDLKGME